MKNKKANYINYQQRATEFAVGDPVIPYGTRAETAGRVKAVFPAIGMVDVEFPHGSKRYPVEELQVVDSSDFWINAPQSDSTPGGSGTVSVPGGPYEFPNPHRYYDYKAEQELQRKLHLEKKLATQNVADRFQKKALYWATRDRKYRANQSESLEGCYSCPKCRDTLLKKCIYKRENGVSERLLGCPSCLFLIKRTDILGCE